MNSNLFVGGFPYETTQEELTSLFGTCGTVKSVKILTDRETGRSRGLAFIEMSDEAQARAAIAKLNGSMVGSRKIFVSEARPKESRPGGFAGKPGPSDRRSGKDRRGPGGGFDREKKGGDWPPAEKGREGSFERKKKWTDKPGFGGKKKWEKRPAWGRDPKKPWGDKKRGGGKPRRFGRDDG